MVFPNVIPFSAFTPSLPSTVEKQHVSISPIVHYVTCKNILSVKTLFKLFDRKNLLRKRCFSIHVSYTFCNVPNQDPPKLTPPHRRLGLCPRPRAYCMFGRITLASYKILDGKCGKNYPMVKV